MGTGHFRTPSLLCFYHHHLTSSPSSVTSPLPSSVYQLTSTDLITHFRYGCTAEAHVGYIYADNALTGISYR